MSEKRDSLDRVIAANETRRHLESLPVGLAESHKNAISPSGGDQIDRILSVVLLLTLVIAICASILVIALPKENEYSTDFFILGANRIADDFPEEIIAGQNYPMFIGLGNHEKRNVTYTIETWNVNTTLNPVTNFSQINSMDPGERFSLTLADNETYIIPYTLSVKKTDYNRAVFLLFNETLPGPFITSSNDRINASYHHLYLHISVRQGFYPESDSDIP